MILTLAVRPVMGGLIVWPISSTSAKEVTAEYDAEVLCNYMEYWTSVMLGTNR